MIQLQEVKNNHLMLTNLVFVLILLKHPEINPLRLLPRLLNNRSKFQDNALPRKNLILNFQLCRLGFLGAVGSPSVGDTGPYSRGKVFVS